MEHPYYGQIVSVSFLVVLGAVRWRYLVLADTPRLDSVSPPVSWGHQIPAYVTSSAWALYVVSLVFLPGRLVAWDRWPVDHQLSDVLAWVAAPLLVAGLALFAYSHSTIGRYWNIDVRIQAGHQLVTSGPYGWVRHPLYTALFMGYLGTIIGLQSWVLFAGLPVFIWSYFIFARKEERVMEQGFGSVYRTYRRDTGMFLPKLSESTWRPNDSSMRTQCPKGKGHEHSRT